MSIGDAWGAGMGSMDKEASFKLLDAFYEAGGNFIDSANSYQNEQSESWLGEWMEKRGIRDQMVVATKYTTNYRTHVLGKNSKAINYGGNNRKSLHVSLRDSLKKLRTDYIDLLYVHWWDYATSVEEVMDALHALVESGKVLYLGVSDTPAWVVAAANSYAKAHGKTPFSVYQGRWSIVDRDFERDIIPMARHFGMALAPWGVLGGGKIQTKKAIAERKARGEGLRSVFGGGQTEAQEKMSEALEKVAKELGVEGNIHAVAIAYVMQKAQYVFPIIGGRKVEHLMANIEGLTIHLTDKQVEELEGALPFDVGFPSNMGADPHYSKNAGMIPSQAFNVEFLQDAKPIGHD
jgi:aryl-alcohol dehydrogenase-like predicted oxidoreductase